MQKLTTDDGPLYIERLSPRQYLRYRSAAHEFDFSCSGAIYTYSLHDSGTLKYEDATHSEYLTFSETSPIGTELLIRNSKLYDIFC